jgi:hypothetical protein
MQFWDFQFGSKKNGKCGYFSSLNHGVFLKVYVTQSFVHDSI